MDDINYEDLDDDTRRQVLDRAYDEVARLHIADALIAVRRRYPHFAGLEIDTFLSGGDVWVDVIFGYTASDVAEALDEDTAETVRVNLTAACRLARTWTYPLGTSSRIPLIKPEGSADDADR